MWAVSVVHAAGYAFECAEGATAGVMVHPMVVGYSLEGVHLYDPIYDYPVQVQVQVQDNLAVYRIGRNRVCLWGHVRSVVEKVYGFEVHWVQVQGDKSGKADVLLDC
jgi:hypothetical protein